MFAAIGRRLSSSGRHRRPPPVAAVVVVDPRLYIFTSILTRRRAQPPCRRHRRPGPGMLHVRRRRVAVVVLAAATVVVGSWLCSPPPVGSVSMLARAGGQNTTKHEGHTGTSDSAPRFCSEHQYTAAAAPEPTPGEPDGPGSQRRSYAWQGREHSKAASTADTVGKAPQSHSVGVGPPFVLTSCWSRLVAHFARPSWSRLRFGSQVGM
ncbi:hypothetical protein AK812_SmicGene25244 [Symbiodinium microadriaticum]|uniref:Uncharacterized protein n=1 Tax=Symbiodinium microadriaticum TaxID=2951 RepID=A0A1Q9DCJ6_SYMMI|nr:hypothetical protein AK812_SmicGene25244 [Symbiodinium microadriaticum]